MHMVLTCTLAQANAVRGLMSTNVAAMWVRDMTDTTKVARVLLADAQVGHVLITFTDESTKPTVAQLQSAFTRNAEIADVQPV